MFSAGFNQKTSKEDLVIKGNHVISQHNQQEKTLEHFRRLSIEAEHDRWAQGVGWPVAPRPPLWCGVFPSLLEPSRLVFAADKCDLI